MIKKKERNKSQKERGREGQSKVRRKKQKGRMLAERWWEERAAQNEQGRRWSDTG